MISHFDLLPYTDDKAMKMLSTQWKYHDPAGIYWTIVNECFTLMTVGNVPRTLSSRVDTDTTVDVNRAAPAIYDELHNYVGWPPSDSSAITESKQTWRSDVHERNKHSYLPEARVFESTPSLKTVDSLFYTGEHESSKALGSITANGRERNASTHAPKRVSFAEQRSQTQRKRTEPCVSSFDGPIIAPRALATSGRRPGVRAKRAARGVAGHHLNNRQARENRTPIHSYWIRMPLCTVFTA